MSEVYCERCCNALTKPGALVFSPPKPDSTVVKWHFCVACWEWLIQEVI